MGGALDWEEAGKIAVRMSVNFLKNHTINNITKISIIHIHQLLIYIYN